MNPLITEDIRQVLHAFHYRPAISIILPFEPKMNPKSELIHSLKIATDKVQKQIQELYPDEIAKLTINKLNSIIKALNFNTHKKSIAIYVSPVFEKVLYLDLLVEEKIIIDDSFEIRDLIYCKKQIHRYLVLIISSKESKILIGNSHEFVRIVSNISKFNEQYEINSTEKVANFSDVSKRHEILSNKFLKQVDNSLDIILNAYQLPLFVIGSEKIIGQFNKLTKHNSSILKYIKGHYLNANSAELNVLLQPYKDDWKKLIHQNILFKLDEAASKKKLVFGMRDVWKEASLQKGQLLVIEKNYMYAAVSSSDKEIIYPAIEPYNKYSYIRDAVDDVIEKVLLNGGDVEFVDETMLTKYHHIALIKFY